MIYKAAGRLDESRETLARLVSAYPDSVWARLAVRYAAAAPTLYHLTGAKP